MQNINLTYLFISIINWLLTKFPNDPTLQSKKLCKYLGHNFEAWISMDASKYTAYKTRRNFMKCSRCDKERKSI